MTTISLVNGKFGAMINGKMIRRSDKKALEKLIQKNTTAEEVVVPCKFSVAKRFSFIDKFIQMIGKKSINSLIITGDPGVGKSYSVVQNLKTLGMKEIIIDNPGDFIFIKGYSTPRALYETFYNYNGKIIVLDDADNIYKDQIASNLMKAALDSGEHRIMNWGAKVHDSDLPTRFEFTGRCIFISNLSINQFPQALLSRSFCVDLTLTVPEKLDRIEMVIHNYNGKTHEVMEFLRENANSIKDLSIRSALSALKLANSTSDWKDLALYSLTV
jgi:hypothetical protein